MRVPPTDKPSLVPATSGARIRLIEIPEQVEHEAKTSIYSRIICQSFTGWVNRYRVKSQLSANVYRRAVEGRNAVRITCEVILILSATVGTNGDKANRVIAIALSKMAKRCIGGHPVRQESGHFIINRLTKLHDSIV